MTSSARGPRRAGGGRRGGTALRVSAAVSVALVALVVGALPALARTPAPGPIDRNTQSDGGLVFNATGNPDLLSGFDRDDYNEKAGPPEVVSSPNIPGRQAIKFSVAPEAQRSEVVPKIPHQRDGDTLFFGYNGFIPDGFPIDADRYQIFMQWHHEGNDGSPPISVNLRDNKIMLAGGDDDPHPSYEKTVAPMAGGQPINIVLKIVFSQDPDEGSIDVWSGGKQVVTDFHPPGGTMYDDGDYLKVGMYRDTKLPDTADVYINNLAVGNDYASVQNAIGAPSASPEAGGSTGAPSTAKPSGRTSSSEGSGFTTGLAVGAIGVAALIAIWLAVTARNRRRSGR